MALAFVAAANSSAVDGTAVTSLTYALNVGAGAERLIVVGAGGFDAGGDATPSGIAYNGDALTSAGSQNVSGNASSLWYLAAPDVNSNNVVVTFPASATAVGSASCAFTGINQLTPISGYDDFAGGPAADLISTINISSATGDLVIDFFYGSGNAPTAITEGANQTSRADYSLTGDTNNWFGQSTEPGGATITMSWTMTAGDSTDEGYLSAMNLKAAPAVSVALTGTATASITEADIVAGGQTIILTVTGDVWVVAAGSLFDNQRQNIINGMDSAQVEATGWDAVVKATQGVSGVVRTSDTVATITLDAFPTYDITATETITVTVPGSALLLGGASVATPTFTVSAVSSGSSLLSLLGVG